MSDAKVPPLVSVILPVYNVSKFLNRCLESILNQTWKNIEIICVNDGSTDNSLDILIDIKTKNPNVLVISTDNRGAGHARNLGLSVARGQYYLFLDSDDFFELDMIELAVNAIEKTNSEICVFRSNTYLYPEGIYQKTDWTIENKLLPSNCFSPKDVERNIFKLFVGWAWDKLYSSDFVKKHNLTFQEQRTTNDMLFVFSSIVLADRITVIDNVLAHHQRGVSSLANTRELSWNCFYNALVAVKKMLVEHKLFERYELDYRNYCLHACLWNLNSLKPPQQKQFYNKLKTEWSDSLCLNDLSYNQTYDKKEYLTLKRIKTSSYEEYIGE